MPEYVALPPHVKLQMHRRCVISKRNSVPKRSHFSVVQRKLSLENYKPLQLSARKTGKPSALNVSIPETNMRFRESSTRCYCLVDLLNSDAATAFDWAPFVDQGLLLTSVFLTYMAGVIPNEKTYFKSQRNIVEEKTQHEFPNASGSTTRYDDQLNLKYACEIVSGKLMESLNSIEYVDDLRKKGINVDKNRIKRPLSLSAITEGPRIRLLCSCLQQLQAEVDNISEDVGTVGTSSWLRVYSEIIQQSFQLVCIAWLEKEISAGNSIPVQTRSYLVFEKLKGDSTISQNIRNLGKEDLYSEFLWFLRFGSVREGRCYDGSLFSVHGIAILEDLVITLADGVASIYLELISIDSTFSNEMNNAGVVLCTLSTRSLQKLRNEVALNQWMHQNMEAVISMYEDCFDLCTLQEQFIDRRSKDQTETFSWWKNLLPRKYELVSSSLSYAVISHFSMPVKRTKELRALTGWRYYFSLFLELSDISMPLIRTMVTKISNAISFFLVGLIGRSLGLIYTGIRQSVRWK